MQNIGPQSFQNTTHASVAEDGHRSEAGPHQEVRVCARECTHECLHWCGVLFRIGRHLQMHAQSEAVCMCVRVCVYFAQTDER